MVNARTLIEILEIVEKYNKDDLCVDAQHDVIYFYLERIEDDVSDEDHKKLLKLGCHQDDDGYAIFT